MATLPSMATLPNMATPPGGDAGLGGGGDDDDAPPSSADESAGSPRLSEVVVECMQPVLRMTYAKLDEIGYFVRQSPLKAFVTLLNLLISINGAH